MTGDDYIRDRRADVEHALASVFEPSQAPPALVDAMRYSLGAGGKRVRPVLCLAGADAVRGDRALAIPAACAIELIHTYSLIHDDLPAMDNDTLRRGKPTLHVVSGEGLAILAGDGLLTEAFRLLARAPVSSDSAIRDRKLRVIEVVAAAAGPAGMVGGQAIDLASVTPPRHGEPLPVLDAAGVTDMHARKTGALIRASATAGAIMGGGSDRQVAAIDRAAAEFGLAFQIVDDVLDVEGGANLGKTAGKDAAAGKPTFISLYGVGRSRQMAAECFARAGAILHDAGVDASYLLDIGRWIVERRH